MIIVVGSMVTGKQTSRHDARAIAESSLLIHTHMVEKKIAGPGVSVLANILLHGQSNHYKIKAFIGDLLMVHPLSSW